jgi:hypothetical protein
MVAATEKYMKRLVSALLAFSMLFFYLPTLGAAETANISHQKLTCIPGDAQAKLLCNVTPLTSIASVRVYFHSLAYKDDYFVEMRRDAGDGFFAILPWADTKITKGVTYRIVGKSVEGAEFSTEQANVPVSSNCPVSLSDNEKTYASHLVLGLTKSGQPSAPPEGFLCKDIDSVITAKGEMKPAEDCRKLLAALLPGAAGASAVGAAAGVSTGVFVAAGVAAAVAGGLIISNNAGGGGNPPVSSARPAAAQPPKHD